MKLVGRMRDVGLRRHLSPLTIECYQRWVQAFLAFCADRATAAAEDDPFDVPVVPPIGEPDAAAPGSGKGDERKR